MRFLLVALMVVSVMPDPVSAKPKTPMFGLFGPMEWSEEHWEGQNYKPLIRDYQFHLPAAQDESRALFTETPSMTPDVFIEQLGHANIITDIRNEHFLFRGETGNIVVEVGSNFYTLSNTDQDMIARLISRSYDQQTYLLKDFYTKKTVGIITPQGLNLH